MANATEVYAIFEGGGAKGLAHVAALAEAQSKGMALTGVAGTSAGAIIAALIAVGYTANQLYDPATGQGLLAGSLSDFFPQDSWQDFKKFSASLKNQLGTRASMWAWLRFLFRWQAFFGRIKAELGLMDTALIEARIDGWLRGGNVEVPAGQARVLFSDLRSELRIIASNTKSRSTIVFSREDTPGISVAKAVAASLAIPFFFRPVRIQFNSGQKTFVDGGIVANFPIWVFNAELRRTAIPTRVVGFRLIAAPTEENSELVSFVEDLYNTAMDANIELHARGMDDLVIVPMEVIVSTFAFDLSAHDKCVLYESARRQAKEGLLVNYFPRHPDVLRRLLTEAFLLFTSWSGLDGRFLRANIAVPTTRKTLRIICGLNMENDADDQMEFDLAASACGESWRSETVVEFDVGQFLRSGADVPGLNKYQRALLRPTLSTILSIPIFDAEHAAVAADGDRKPLIGILNFDSDVITMAQFGRSKPYGELAALLLASYLKSPMQANA